MKSRPFVLLLAFFLTTFLFIGILVFVRTSNKPKITLLLPVEHTSLQHIVEGFQAELEEDSIDIRVENAQGDAQLGQTIIDQIKLSSTNLVVPVGTTMTHAAIQNIKKKNILFLAALLNEEEKAQIAQSKIAITGVEDEVAMSAYWKFLRTIFPTARKICLIQSFDNRIYHQGLKLKKLAQGDGITVQHLVISSLSELNTAIYSIEKDNEMICILKDHLIVKGVDQLIAWANLNQIPLITADEGTVLQGAACGFGISERNVGLRGAKMARALLKNPRVTPPIVSLANEAKVFLSLEGCVNQGVDPNLLRNAVEQYNIPIEVLQENTLFDFSHIN